jgi:hypothetical protein
LAVRTRRSPSQSAYQKLEQNQYRFRSDIKCPGRVERASLTSMSKTKSRSEMVIIYAVERIRWHLSSMSHISFSLENVLVILY